jgi:hypothetical protein
VPEAIAAKDGLLALYVSTGQLEKFSEVNNMFIMRKRGDAKAFEHRFQALARERGVPERVTGAGETNDEAVADELVLADAFEVGDVFDAGARVRHWSRDRCGHGGDGADGKQR